MKIAILSPSFLPHVGGAEFVAHNLGQAWGQQGHEVQIVNWVSDEISHPEATYTTARFKLLRGAPRVGYHRFPFVQYTVRQLNTILDRFNPDFVAGHMGLSHRTIPCTGPPPTPIYPDLPWARSHPF